MDKLTPEERSAHMARVRSQDTKPEMTVRQLVFRMGYRYRLHRRDLPGKPDLVFSSRKKVIFVHGCFWYGHKCSRGRMPKSRIDFWTKKITSNRERDEKNLEKLTALGWKALVIWECELPDKTQLEQRIKEFLDDLENDLPSALDDGGECEKAAEVQSRDYSVISFFAGCGGLDLGMLGGFTYIDTELERLPFKVVAAYDHNEKCLSTYSKNIGSHVEIKDLANASPEEMPSADILIGGFPCQDFSSCGPKGGLDSERGRLYQSMIRYMRQHKPKVVIAENVPHLAKMDNGSVLEIIIADLRSVGYRFEVWNLYAPDYGVPQNRTRLFFVGVQEDIPGHTLAGAG